MCNLGRVPFTGENEREPGENKNKSVVFDLPRGQRQNANYLDDRLPKKVR